MVEVDATTRVMGAAGTVSLIYTFEGWPQPFKTGPDGGQFRHDGRPISQWARIAAGRSIELGPVRS